MDLINENENLIHCLEELRDELKIESLDDNERKYAQILDEYLRICFMDEQIEELINCIKMIQFNYISKDE